MKIGRVAGDLIRNPILGCQDKLVRILNGDNVLYTISVPAPITFICQYKAEHYLYGCSDGSLGLLHLGREKGENMWNTHTSNKNSITAMKICDFSRVRFIKLYKIDRRR